MTLTLARLAALSLVRAPGRAGTRVLVLATAVALLGAMLLFIGHSLRTMTASAVRSVPLDWQGPVSSYAADLRVATEVGRQPGVAEAVPTATAPFASAEHHGSAGTIRAGAGAILAVPPGYLRHIRTFRLLYGSLKPGAIVLDQQLAATLQAQVGDTIALSPRPGVKPRAFRVSGVAALTAGDVLFQPLNPLVGPAPAQPPANVAILPLVTFAHTVAPELGSIPSVGPGATTATGAPRGVQWHVQAQVDPRALTGSPSRALRLESRIRNRVQRSLPGQVQFVDNLADELSTATADSLYAQALFVMLAGPGALIALGLAYLASLGTAERDGRDLALLRARGASRRHLLTLAAIESMLLGVLAGVVGAGASFLAVRLLVRSGGGLDLARVLSTVAVCVLLAIGGALVARVGVTVTVLRGSVVEGRRSTRRAGSPLWQRLHVDGLALAASGLIYWLTARTGFAAVVNPDANPTLSLSVYMFFGPALLWVGATLLLVRARGRALAWLSARFAGRRATTLPAFLLASAGRRGPAINRGLVLVGLLLAYGVSLGVFTATYDQQARVDAQLTLGADVVVSAPSGVGESLQRAIAHAPGVAATSTLEHTYAYVGPDLQDTFGIDPTTLPRATDLRDSFFLGGSATEMLARLRSRPDAILVSKETVTDYALSVGDLLKLRILDRRRGRFRIVPFHVVGVVQEFPSAPKDSFMVANLRYLLAVTHDPGPNVVFVKANGDPVALAGELSRETARAGTTVKNIRQQTAQTVSSITAIGMAGIRQIEGSFVVVLAAAAMALFVAVAVTERRRELATMAAIGASIRDIAGFVWSEAALVLVAAMALASLLGWLLAEMLVAMLRHVFDPPPDHLAAPWGFLGALAGASVLGILFTGVVAVRRMRRLQLGAILREE